MIKITNKYNLPQAMIDSVSDSHPIVDKHYSVTEILNPIREIILMRRHQDELSQDISDMTWMIFGSAVHKMFEEADKTGTSELKLKAETIEGYYLTGITDHYNEKDLSVEDYKTSSVFKVLKQDFEDWRKQGLMYSWLLRKSGKYTRRERFISLLKDWSASDAKYKTDYPKCPIYIYENNINEVDNLEIQKFIIDKFTELKRCESLTDDELPICTAEERWNSGDKYAVMKQGRKSAIKVCDSREEAETYMTPGTFIELRKGEDKKCDNYCLCNRFCKYYKEKRYEK